jgi:acyl transferase domain-containing protein/NADPH:quinone reductase-like Zn-dependent oxidoreductase/acyl carrier protein
MKNKRVAILGFSFRLPGSSRDRFWPDLLSGRNLVTQTDSERWDQNAFWHPRKSHPGTSYTFAAGSIGDVSAFDADFFGISPREAAQIDPQQRVLLELSWEALENSGVRLSDVRGSHCGVYVGISTNDYSLRFADDLAVIDSSAATGTSTSITANRISYFFDLRGPSMAVDTACSSSLVAFHLACRSIASGESTQAIVGGVSLHLHPFGFVAFAKASMLSRRGMCSVFDASGDGYVRSEGAGAFFLKDYDQALADGNRILAVVQGSVVNSDGKSSGLTVPSLQSQVALLRQAYSEAGIAPSEIDYVEAHGTGTAVGDPIETHALGEALGQRRSRDKPLLIGSVKSNLGHLEAAAGTAGLIKALYCIQHRTVPANIHLDNPNPNIQFDEWNLKVVSSPTPLKQTGKLIIGINSFGFGGTNAHVILESPETRAIDQQIRPGSLPVPVVISGKSMLALKAAARDLSAFVRDRDDSELYDIAYSAAFHREWHEHRAIVRADNTKFLASTLASFAEDAESPAAVETGTVAPPFAGLAFVYSGNGSVWEGMGRRLMAEEPVFRDAVLQIDEIFRPRAGWSLVDELAGSNGPGRYEYTEIAQPALFAMQVGVTEVLRRRGILPAAVVGHSVGEIAAAWACGALSLEQAVSVIYQRSQLQGTTKGKGRMTAVALGETAARELLEQAGLSRVLCVAGINSSNSVTVAGEVAALESLEAALAQRKVSFKRLDLDYAFHSPAMDAIETDIVTALADLRPVPSRIPFYSSVTGGRLDGTELQADYWRRNICDPVRFEQAVKSMLAQGTSVVAEIGPHAQLRGYVVTCLRDEDIQGRVVPTVLREDDSPDRIWSAVCQIAISGAPLDWKAFFPQRGRFVQLPNYSWQRERHWHGVSTESYQRLNRHREHPLLGYRLHENEWAWESQIDTQLCPTLADHVVGDAIVMPGTAYAEMALAAARLWHGSETVEIEQLEIRSPLILSDSQTKIVRFSIDSPDGSFTIRSRDHLTDTAWTLHAVGRILRESGTMLLPKSPLTLPARSPDCTGADHDGLTKAAGLDYGPAFRAIDAVWVEGGSALARLRVPQIVESELGRVNLHPALLDCTLQLIIQLLKDDYIARAGTIYVPASFDGLFFRSGRTTPHMARATLHRCSPHSLTASFAMFDAEGEIVAWIEEARFSSVRLRKDPAERLRYLDYHTIPKPHPLTPVTAPHPLFEQLQKRLSDVANFAPRASALKRYTDEIEPLLDALCSRFAARALKSLSANGNVLTEADILKCTDANSEAAPLLARLIAILEEDKAVAAGRNEWHFLPEQDPAAPEDIWNSLVADYPDYIAVFHAVGRVGLQLADLLTGRTSPGQVLPRDCTLSRLRHPVLADAGMRAIEHAIQDLVAQVPGHLQSGERLRILELGAGRPSFAAVICKVVDFNRCDYTFATTAPTVSEEWYSLQERFPAAQLRLIMPDEPLESAAMPAAEQYHLALVTSDFDTENDALLALAYAKRYLSPGGSVLVIEQQQSRWMDFVFGTRRAWWSPAPDGSWASRHKPAQFWRHQMQKAGLQAGVTLELSPGGASVPYILLSQRAEQASAASQPAQLVARNWLLLADKEGFSARLSAQLGKMLQARGDCVIQATPGGHFAALNALHYQVAPHDSADYQTLFGRLESSHGRIDGILHLHGLSASKEDSDPLLLLERQVDRCAAAAAILRACETTGISTSCWLVTAQAPSTCLRGRNQQGKSAGLAESMDAALWGFGRTMMNEASNISVRLVDVDDQTSLDTLAYSLAREISNPDAEQEVVLTASGDRYVMRLQVEAPPAYQPPAPAAFKPTVLRLGFEFPGQLRNLRWESRPHVPPAHDELEIEVQATGLNFRDVMYTLGLLPDRAVENGFAGPTLGLEFAGIVTAVGSRVRDFAPGDRVLGFGPGSFSNLIVTKADCVSPIPAGLTFEAAATIPSAFFTVYYALNHLARIEEGEKILIHGAAGGVGIAAIQVAKWKGAEIFATAGSPEKRDFLRLLGVDHVLDSRSLAFADEVMAITEGGGVDVVLNSLAGEAIDRNLRILKPFGRFLELGKRDFEENTKIGLRPFRNNISYFGIDADALMKERPDFTARLYREMLALFEEGVLHPLPYRCFEAEEIVDAFRYMQQSRHIGKIVVTYKSGMYPMHTARQEKRRLELSADASYLVTGGLSGFGLKTAEWLVSRGARNLVLVGRRGLVTPEARAAVADLECAGVRVHAAACDITDIKALASLLSEIAVILPPLKGIVHAATVIEDGLIRNLGRDQIRRVFAPKVLGAQYLHQLTLGKQLEFFILFSSATTLFGNPGQGNYVAANAGLEALAAVRRSAGLPALCVRWGAIDDAGYLARNAKIKEALQGRMGGSPIQSAVALNALEELLLADRSGLGVLDLDWNALKRFLPTAASPKFSALAPAADDVKVDDESTEDVRRLLSTLSVEELSATFVQMLKKLVGEILRTPAAKIDEHRSLYDMGLDSLMGVELSTAVEARFAVRLPVMALSDNPTIARLSAQIISQLNGSNGADEVHVNSEAADQVRHMAAQHAEELHADVVALTASKLQSEELAASSRMIH